MQFRESTKSRKERVRPKIWKDKLCIFVVWQDEMKMRCCLSTPGSPEYIHSVAHSTSVTHVSPYTHPRSIGIYFEAVIKLVWRCTWRPGWSELRRCTWRPWSIEFGEALGGRDEGNSEMHFEAVIDWDWGCTGRPWSSEFGDAIGDHNWENSEMNLEAVIEGVSTCTWRPKSSELRDTLRGCDWASLDMYLQAMIEQDWWSIWRRSIWREARQLLRLDS